MKKQPQTFVMRLMLSTTLIMSAAQGAYAMGAKYPGGTGAATPTPTPTPSATPKPTATPVIAPTATPAPSATPTPQPAATPVVSKPSPTPSPIPSAALAPLRDSQATAGASWTAHLYTSIDTLGTSLLNSNPADGATFCPQYANLSTAQRKAFWIYLISAMAKFESNFKPSMTYTESFKNADGEYVVSRGLLQLSVEDGQIYGCGFTSSDAVYDPDLNLDCSVRILNYWMKKDARIAGQVNGSWRGGARYWSTLRSNGSPYASIVKLTQKIPFCK